MEAMLDEAGVFEAEIMSSIYGITKVAFPKMTMSHILMFKNELDVEFVDYLNETNRGDESDEYVNDPLVWRLRHTDEPIFRTHMIAKPVKKKQDNLSALYCNRPAQYELASYVVIRYHRYALDQFRISPVRHEVVPDGLPLVLAGMWVGVCRRGFKRR